MGNSLKNLQTCSQGVVHIAYNPCHGWSIVFNHERLLPTNKKYKEILTRLSQHRQRYEIGLYNGAALYI